MSRRLNWPWLGVLSLAFLTVLAASLLVGYSVWFLSTVSLVGLSAAAYTFNFHIPAAIIRLLALTRVATGLGERLWGHSLALGEQARHRLLHFRNAARDYRLETQNWQLARGDRLHGFMASIEAVEFRMLRVRIPALHLSILAGLLMLVAGFISLAALGILGLAFVSVLFLARQSYKKVLSEATRQDAALKKSGGHLATLAFSARPLRGSGALESHLATWQDQEVACEEARQNNQKNIQGLERLIWAIGLLTAACLLLISPQDSAPLAAFLAFWALAVFAALAQIPNLLLAAAAAKSAEHTLNASAPKTSVPDLKIDIEQASDMLQRGSLCLVGPSGSGKTLALKALAHDLAAKGWRVGLALHDAAILQMTWRENLDPNGGMRDNELFEALDQVDLLSTCLDRGGLDTMLTGQSALSSGQAHRLGLARLIVGNFDVALIDELGEHLSSDQRKTLALRVKNVLQDSPLVVATHDPSVAAYFNQIIKLR